MAVGGWMPLHLGSHRQKAIKWLLLLLTCKAILDIKSHCRADEGSGVSAVQSAAHHLQRRRLYRITDSSQVRHAGVKARTTD